VKKLIAFLSVSYAVYGALVGAYIISLIFRVFHEQMIADAPPTKLQTLPLLSISLIAATFILLFVVVAYLLALRPARRTVIVLAAVSCLGIPLGTIIGLVTIYVLTRSRAVALFTPTA
jgi:hypothetical protein